MNPFDGYINDSIDCYQRFTPSTMLIERPIGTTTEPCGTSS